MKSYSIYALAIWAIVVSSFANASLMWDPTHRTIEAAADQDEAVASFGFVNAGRTAATIESVTTSCGCTTADLGRTVYEPGERGVIRAAFRFGDRVGLHTKKVIVRTSARSPGEDVRWSVIC